MGENTTMELKSNEAALILDENWNMQIYIPNDIDDDEDTPLNMRYLTMLAVLTKDDEFVEDILGRFHKLAEINYFDEDETDI